MYGLNKIGLLQRYKPIQGREVAQAMIHAADKQQSGSYTLNEVFDLGQIVSIIAKLYASHFV